MITVVNTRLLKTFVKHIKLNNMALTNETHICPECLTVWDSEDSEYCPICGTHYNENQGNLEINNID